MVYFTPLPGPWLRRWLPPSVAISLQPPPRHQTRRLLRREAACVSILMSSIVDGGEERRDSNLFWERYSHRYFRELQRIPAIYIHQLLMSARRQRENGG